MVKQRGSTAAVGVEAGGSRGVLTPREFAALFERASRRLWCVAVGVVGDGSLAEDVVQEAAGIALTKLEQFDTQTSFHAWMGQIVRFVAMNERRRGGRQRTSAVDPAALDGRVGAAGREEPEDRGPIDRNGRLVAGQDAFDDALTVALGKLGETARACLLLRTVLELSYAEIAEVLGIPEGTAMSHVHRSRHALRARLGGAGGAGGSGAEGSAR